MRSTLCTVLLTLCCLVSAAAQPVFTEDAKLVGSGTSKFANPGWSIAAAADFVVLGGRLDDSVYVFRETGGGWEEEAALRASEPSFFTFGFSVGAWSGGGEDVALVGAYGDSDRPESDAAYIFRRSGDGVWAEEARLSDGPEAWEYFGGTAVAIGGNYAVVGALGADDFGEATGAAYIFRRTTTGIWGEDVRLLASDASALAGFGRGVAMIVSSEGVPFVLIGAPSDSDQRGAAYAFRRATDGTWVEEAKLTAPDSDTGDLFALGVALAETPEGDILALAGALGDRDAGLQSGAGYVFRRESGGTWAFEEKLTAADGQSGQRLGWSVALAAAPAVGGTVAVLGADGAYNFAGTVRLFRRTTEGGAPVWREEAELWASARAPGDELGQSVAATGRYAVAGAPNNDGEGGPAGPGAGYVWDLERAVPAEPAPTASADGAELTAWPNPSAGGAVSLRLRLARAGHVRLEAFDALGRRVVVLADRRMTAGEHVVPLLSGTWRAGTYFLRLRTEAEVVTVPLTLLE